MIGRKRRTYNTRLIRVSLSYSVQEIAELYGLHKNAVLRWIKGGLPVIDQRKPYLIYGAELSAYLKKRQSGRKHKCGPHEFFCFKCRKPCAALENAVDIEIRNEKTLALSALCGGCGTIMRRVGSVRKLDEYQKIFSVQKLHRSHITERSKTCPMCDSGEDTSA